ncbi:hypothetical protein L6452_20417 [Arctium lappa]|uniref:Uncharacterized protein n=1 Tax=Arctium lappa TaxID=4217 RepID=A0ACB9BBT9_ARCLA|nr:hypothetical protein L6452_20417 [Arctium lappa]
MAATCRTTQSKPFLGRFPAIESPSKIELKVEYRPSCSYNLTLAPIFMLQFHPSIGGALSLYISSGFHFFFVYFIWVSGAEMDFDFKSRFEKRIGNVNMNSFTTILLGPKFWRRLREMMLNSEMFLVITLGSQSR